MVAKEVRLPASQGAKKCQEGPLEGCPMAAAPIVSKVLRILLSRVRDANCRG